MGSDFFLQFSDVVSMARDLALNGDGNLEHV
jgi:hypothetical protein